MKKFAIVLAATGECLPWMRLTSCTANVTDRGFAYTLFFSERGSGFDSYVMGDLEELYMWYGTEEEYLGYLSDTLQAKFRALIDGGNSDINNIPQPLLEEYRDFMHRRYKHSGSFRYQGLPVRAVFK